MPGRPKGQLRKFAPIEQAAVDLAVNVIKAGPPWKRREDCIRSERDRVGEGWLDATVFTIFAAVYACKLGDRLRERAGITDPPSPLPTLVRTCEEFGIPDHYLQPDGPTREFTAEEREFYDSYGPF